MQKSIASTENSDTQEAKEKMGNIYRTTRHIISETPLQVATWVIASTAIATTSFALFSPETPTNAALLLTGFLFAIGVSALGAALTARQFEDPYARGFKERILDSRGFEAASVAVGFTLLLAFCAAALLYMLAGAGAPFLIIVAISILVLIAGSAWVASKTAYAALMFGQGNVNFDGFKAALFIIAPVVVVDAGFGVAGVSIVLFPAAFFFAVLTATVATGSAMKRHRFTMSA